MKNLLVLFLVFTINTIYSQTDEVSDWGTSFYVDDFGDFTDEEYSLYIDRDGRFSNSATSGSELITQIIIDDKYIRFKLHEYGRSSSVGEEVGYASYVLKVKGDSEVYKYKLKASKNELWLKADDRYSFIQMLKFEKIKLKAFLKIDGEYSSSTYNFSISPIL